MLFADVVSESQTWCSHRVPSPPRWSHLWTVWQSKYRSRRWVTWPCEAEPTNTNVATMFFCCVTQNIVRWDQWEIPAERHF